MGPSERRDLGVGRPKSLYLDPRASHVLLNAFKVHLCHLGSAVIGTPFGYKCH
jgi:hypothetical protein